MPDMLRRLVVGCMALLLLGGYPVSAQTPAEELVRVLMLAEVGAVLRDEGRLYGQEIDRDMLAGRGGVLWARDIDQLYDPLVMQQALGSAFATSMSESHITRSIGFFDNPRGQNILALEISARRAMADPSVEEIARASYADLKGSDDRHFSAVDRFVVVNDLIERNVAGALSSSFQYFRGLSDGGAVAMDEAEILEFVWSQEVETRRDTESWLYGFLLMAYRPLPASDLDAYIDFSATPAGRSLNAAMFDGFDSLYNEISFALGLSLAAAMAQAARGSDL